MQAEAEQLEIEVSRFLEEVPLLAMRAVAAEIEPSSGYYSKLKLPSIQLHCTSATCAGRRFFDPPQSGAQFPTPDFGKFGTTAFFASYSCRNCEKTWKTFALRLHVSHQATGFQCWLTKIGEDPAFGEPRPNVIKDVLDDEIDYFQRGYQAETQGLGIGAFAYYRRFVESHKDKLIDTLQKVAVAQAAGDDVLRALERARKTNSFEKAVDEIKDAIPPGMRLKGGHNPLTLLHSALSVGVHKDDDAECLSRARDIRTVLTALATKTTEALADSAELTAAVGRLTNRKTAKPAP